MAAFSYRALNTDGKVVKGTIEGDSERQIRSQLRTQKLKPIHVESTRVKPQSSRSNSSFSLSAVFTKLSGEGASAKARLSTRDLTLLTRQLASMIQSGMTVDESLQSVSRQTRKEKVKQIVFASALACTRRFRGWLRQWLSIQSL